jgi:hypothetical protein
LHLACSQGHIEIVKALVAVGNADVNISAGDNRTPLHCAAREGKVKIVTYLLMHKANPEYVEVGKSRLLDNAGKKPIDVSTSPKITAMLEKHRVHVETKEKSAKVPGDHLRKELKIKPALDHKGLLAPPKPPTIRGYLFKLGKVLGGRNKRFFELNPIEGTMAKYMGRQDCPKNPKELYCLAEIVNVTRLPASGVQKFHYFQANMSLIS